jgi:hypothetical protein
MKNLLIHWLEHVGHLDVKTTLRAGDFVSRHFVEHIAGSG